MTLNDLEEILISDRLPHITNLILKLYDGFFNALTIHLTFLVNILYEWIDVVLEMTVLFWCSGLPTVVVVAVDVQSVTPSEIIPF